MRYLKYAFLAVLALCLVTVALANRQSVTLTLLPEEMALFSGIALQIQLPLFFVVFGGIVAGLLIGFVWEWFREHRHRADAANAKREAGKLEREVRRLKKSSKEEQDDVLALLEDTAKAG